MVGQADFVFDKTVDKGFKDRIQQKWLIATMA
jgi:hypothetical protein